jgi:hypothetical protein
VDALVIERMNVAKAFLFCINVFFLLYHLNCILILLSIMRYCLSVFEGDFLCSRMKFGLVLPCWVR